MADNEKKRRKTLLISMLVFLVSGGGIFLFFVIQGANDLTGAGKQAMFSYGYAVRDAVTPLFKALGIITSQDEMVRETKERWKARGVDISKGVAAPDVSDWMSKGGSNSSGRNGSGVTSLPSTSIPHMMGSRLGGLGGMGGGSSKSSNSLSRFAARSGSADASISSSGGGGAFPGAGKGTLGELRNARTMLTAGLESGSAMKAKGMWDRSFGVGGGNSGTSRLKYNDSGLVSLDKIKSGAIADLKMGDTGNAPGASGPKQDVTGSETALANDKSVQKAMEEQMKEALAKNALDSLGNSMSNNSGNGSPGDSGSGAPPDDVTAVGNNTKPPDGQYCPQGKTLADGSSFKDNPPQYSKEGQTWTVTYTGTQKMPDGSSFNYSDKMVVNPGGNPPLLPYGSTCNGTPCDGGFGGE